MKGRSYEVLPTEGGDNNNNSELSSQRGGTLSEGPKHHAQPTNIHKFGNRSRNRGEARARVTAVHFVGVGVHFASQQYISEGIIIKVSANITSHDS